MSFTHFHENMLKFIDFYKNIQDSNYRFFL